MVKTEPTSIFGKPQPFLDERGWPLPPEHYRHKGRTIYVVPLIGLVTDECLRWINERQGDCAMYSHINEALTFYTNAKITEGLSKMAEEGETSIKINPGICAYVKFKDAALATEFKLRFADMFAE